MIVNILHTSTQFEHLSPDVLSQICLRSPGSATTSLVCQTHVGHLLNPDKISGYSPFINENKNCYDMVI